MELPEPKTRQEYMAQLIAQTFNDEEKLKMYRTYCKKYSLSLIERAFAEARSYPADHIKKSRAAIFFYLIKQYAHRSK
jgi:hypothetical protein